MRDTILVILLAITTGSLLFNGGQFVLERERQVQRILARQSPVVVDVKIVDSYEKDGKLYVQVVANKVRKCEDFISITGTYGDKITQIRFLSDKEKDGTFKKPDSNPVGVQDFGVWELDPSPYGEPVTVETVHRCNGELVVTKLGTFYPKDYK